MGRNANSAEEPNKPWCFVGDYNDSMGVNIRGSNNRYTPESLEKIDRALVTDAWPKNAQTYHHSFTKCRVDHAPYMEMTEKEEDYIKYFKFLNCWADQPKFLDTVKASWERTVGGIACGDFTLAPVLLSYGGRAILVKHVLQSLPIHLLSASDPPDVSDTIEHIFNNGHFTYMWKSFAAAGITNDHVSLPLLLAIVVTKYNNAKTQITLTSYTYIHLLEPLEESLGSKYGGKSPNVSRVKYAIYKDNYKLMSTISPKSNGLQTGRICFKLGENCIHDTKVILIKWIKPPNHWVKINTDGVH
ncbi:hypothetical protein H5410_013521 [Solanum commersonii]|uniref:Uncharacterized protein n=1 Tax=Solanum commersonii TaxID=4109 RepID=A0A9J5ZNG2_SOLCO|nr:hypothetical protein H5410_013521 [Solanum commersonii]